MQKGKFLLVATLLSSTLFANEAKDMYNSCRFCHGESGEKVYMEQIQPINKLSKEVLVDLLLRYKNTNYQKIGLGSLMKMQVSKLSKEDIDILANYIKSF